MVDRPNLDTYFLRIATEVATRSTCLRRAVGCVLVDVRGRVLSTGYNGVAAGSPHCNEFVELPLDEARRLRDAGHKHVVIIDDRLVGAYPYACVGAHAASGTELDACGAVHAEQNAALSVGDAWAIHSCYVTTSPCVSCVKLLLNSSCQRIIFTEEYPVPTARELWVATGREWLRVDVRHVPRAVVGA